MEFESTERSAAFMIVFVVWIDSQNAKLFQFSNEMMERRSVHSGHPNHPNHRIDQEEKNRIEKSFFDDVTSQIASGTQILILGPGVAKHQFHNHLCEQFPAIAKRISGCETVDHPSDGEIATLARRFFKSGFGSIA